MSRSRGVTAALLVLGATPAWAAKLSSVETLDSGYVVVHVLDGEVAHHEGALDTVTRHAPPLETAAAALAGSWTIRSAGDPFYGGSGLHPTRCWRKTRLNGHAQLEWSRALGDYRYESTDEHFLYLELPRPLQKGRRYTLDVAGATGIDARAATFVFDPVSSRSEAVHVNVVGYALSAPHAAADVHHWMGDGGARDYSAFEGAVVRLHDVRRGTTEPVGRLRFWKPEGADVGGYHLTRSPVWTADFGGARRPGTYRLVVDGIGCSQDFEVGPDVFADPFRVALRGFFYLRVGQDNSAGLRPPPRTPLYIPGKSPANTRVYLTEMHPWHPDWRTFSRGDAWDRPEDWARYRRLGHPTNPAVRGGHADAFDWDRHLGHVSIVYDMLLPFVLTRGAPRDDDTGIAESGNGLPDLLDEARYEVDFWLALRDGPGYSHGVTNPDRNDRLFQAAPTAMAAWASAANAAMLADALRLAGARVLEERYRVAAALAFAHASGLEDRMLDHRQDVGQGVVRGRDLRMTAAAYLYNVTGDRRYEDVVRAESVCAGGPADLENGERNQIWATAGYLFTPRQVHYPELRASMRAAFLAEAGTKEVALTRTRPSRRATDERAAYFRTIQNVQRTLVAHALAEDPAEKEVFRRAIALEADWGLGRNPLNLVEMGTAETPLASRRSVAWMYTTGREDGVPGLHPGHTPYCNLDDWAPGMVMGTPSRLYERAYPADFRRTWPVAEGCFETPWVWAHSEFTPQQTMRGKIALYAYLHALAATR